MDTRHIFPILLLAMLPVLALAQKDASRAATSHFLRGVQLFQEGKNDQAKEELLKARELDPKNDAVHYYLGYIATSQNDVNGAIEGFSEARRLDSTNYWYNLRMASLYSALGRTDKADSLYSRMLEKRPNDMALISYSAETALDKGDADRADSLLNRLERIGGPSDYTNMTRLEILRQKGDFKQFFSKMNLIFSDDALPAKFKTDMLNRLLKGADPRFNYVHLADYDTLLTTCLRTHPGDTSVAHLAASLYYSTDRADDVLALCRDYPEDLEMASFMTYTYLIKKKDYKAALRSCENLVRISERDKKDLVAAYTTTADCHQYLGQHEAAFREYDKALKVDPTSIGTLNNYAYHLSVVRRKLPKAAHMARKAIEAEPENPTYLDTYAWILFQQKKYSAAKTYFKKALLYGGKENAEILDHYAATLEALGETSVAEGYRQQAAIKRNGKKN